MQLFCASSDRSPAPVGCAQRFVQHSRGPRFWPSLRRRPRPWFLRVLLLVLSHRLFHPSSSCSPFPFCVRISRVSYPVPPALPVASPSRIVRVSAEPRPAQPRSVSRFCASLPRLLFLSPFPTGSRRQQKPITTLAVARTHWLFRSPGVHSVPRFHWWRRSFASGCAQNWPVYVRRAVPGTQRRTALAFAPSASSGQFSPLRLCWGSSLPSSPARVYRLPRRPRPRFSALSPWSFVPSSTLCAPMFVDLDRFLFLSCRNASYRGPAALLFRRVALPRLSPGSRCALTRGVFAKASPPQPQVFISVALTFSALPARCLQEGLLLCPCVFHDPASAPTRLRPPEYGSSRSCYAAALHRALAKPCAVYFCGSAGGV
ncbi:hypothetical protein TRVL_05327 [Trypanosoma vivax]|nr:hypothetical protein TRVL_05327 [Trypanosoma vivax]